MAPNTRFKDHHQEIKTFGYRAILVAAVIVLLFLALAARYYYLQVVEHEKYVTRSDRNRILVQTVPPKRGLIFDRHGKLLADNRPSYTLTVVPELINNMDEVLSALKPLVTIEPRDIELYERLNNQPRRPYQPIPLRHKLTEDEIARIAVNENSLPGIAVQAQLVRFYPKRETYAHTVGNVGKISERDTLRFTDEQKERYKGFHLIGKTGIERFYEPVLYGENGYLHVEKNATNRILRTLERKPSVPGKDLHLHLDSELQEEAMRLLKDKRGAIVAMDVNTGGILAMVSMPTYDPNPFVTGISHDAYNAIALNPDSPQLNRAIQGRYPPASTIKPMFGLAGLKHGIVTPSFRYYDPGYYQIENDKRKYRDWKRGGHGWVDVTRAIVQSSDTYFYHLAHKMGVDTMHDFGSQFGLGARLGIDIPSENPGLWPSRQWKEDRLRAPWFPGDSINLGIGQGYSGATPLQLAVMTATLATRGTRYRPTIVKAIGDAPVEPEIVHQVEASNDHWDVVFKAMHDVVHAKNGTAKRINQGIEYLMGGKTGTAQKVGIPQNARYDSEALKERNRDHGLFIGFAPLNKPQIAVSVFVENGESGSRAAAPLARAILDMYLIQQNNIDPSQKLSALNE